MTMAVTSCGGRAPLVAAAATYPTPRNVLCSPRRAQDTGKESRRCLLGTAFLLAAVTPEYPPKSQLIEQLLERSRANKAKNDQQRLNSYYERNYKEYFEFVEGTIKNKSELTETEKGILKWLDKTRSKKK